MSSNVVYAIVKAGGRQEKVAVGDIVVVYRLSAQTGDSVQLPALLLVDGETVTTDAAALRGILDGQHWELMFWRRGASDLNYRRFFDINDLAELAYIREQDGEIRIGALTRHVDLLKSELLARHFPLFADAETVIADPVVRNRGTIGGSLCQADAAEDLSAVCSAAKAHVIIKGSGGEREVDMADFHVGPYMTAVGAGELLTEILLPIFPGAGSAHEKVERRAGDWAIAAASAAVWIEGGKLSQVGIALSAVGLTTIHLTRAEDLLRGQAPSEDLFAQAREIAISTHAGTSDLAAQTLGTAASVCSRITS